MGTFVADIPDELNHERTPLETRHLLCSNLSSSNLYMAALGGRCHVPKCQEEGSHMRAIAPQHPPSRDVCSWL